MSLGYQAFEDPYLYKREGVLKNKAGLRDAAALEAFELEMTSVRAEEPLPSGVYDVRHYRSLHHHLFQDVYSWAGKFRRIRMAKGGNMFCYPENIEREMNNQFELVPPVLSAKDDLAFIAGAAEFLAGLNAIHPFRDGNGRSQLSFLAMLGEAAGRPLDLTRVTRKRILPAMIASFHEDLRPLKHEIGSLLR